MKSIIILDTETSGFTPSDSHLLEMGMAEYSISYAGLARCESFLIRAPVKPAALEINGISQQLVDAHGECDWRIASDQVHEWFVGNDDVEPIAIVAHNSSFDRQWFMPDVQAIPWVCSMRDLDWPERARAGSCSLEMLALAHGVAVLPGHRAIHDVLTLVRVFDAVIKVHGPGYVEQMIRSALRPRATYQACVPFERNHEAKAVGFEFDAKSKRWLKQIAIADVDNLNYPFRVVRIGQ